MNINIYLHHADEIDTEIFDLLMSLGDFDEFKQLMVAHKKEKKARINGDIAPMAVIGTHFTAN